MSHSITIPSCKSIDELRMMVEAIKTLDRVPQTYLPSGFAVSAAVNRNYCLMNAPESDFIIMMDDDIGGFFEGWQDELVRPLEEFPRCRMASARLMTPEGSLSPMMGTDSNLGKEFSPGGKAILSACIAFRQKDVEGIWYDEGYVGSGFEDSDYCFQMRDRYSDMDIVVNNECQLVHYHAMTNQKEHFLDNQKRFLSKWGNESLRGVL